MVRLLVFLCFTVLLAASIFMVSCNRQPGFHYQKKLENITTTVTSGDKPLVKGSNKLKLSIVDSSGAVIPEARVNVHYFNKPEAGRQQFDMLVPAFAEEGSYGFVADFPEPGEWNFEIHITRHTTKQPPFDLVFKAEVE